jgi:hypothetical protein
MWETHFDHAGLLLLQLDDPTLDAVLDHHASNSADTCLSDTMDTVGSLLYLLTTGTSTRGGQGGAANLPFDTRIPPRLHEKDLVGFN